MLVDIGDCGTTSCDCSSTGHARPVIVASAGCPRGRLLYAGGKSPTLAGRWWRGVPKGRGMVSQLNSKNVSVIVTPRPRMDLGLPRTGDAEHRNFAATGSPSPVPSFLCMYLGANYGSTCLWDFPAPPGPNCHSLC